MIQYCQQGNSATLISSVVRHNLCQYLSKICKHLTFFTGVQAFNEKKSYMTKYYYFITSEVKSKVLNTVEDPMENFNISFKTVKKAEKGFRFRRESRFHLRYIAKLHLLRRLSYSVVTGDTGYGLN